MSAESMVPRMEILPSSMVSKEPDNDGAKRNDVRYMAHELEADILNPTTPEKSSRFLQILGDKVRINLDQANRALDGNPPVVLSTSEISGIGIEAMRPFHRNWKGKHVVIAHKLDSGLKSKVQKYWKWFNTADALICPSQIQYNYAKDVLGIPEEKLHLIHIGIDTNWYTPPEAKNESESPYALAVGKEQRDYPTLLEAMKIVKATRPDIKLKIVAGSHWSTYSGKTETATPDNVEFETKFLSEEELRTLYQQARLSIVPINADQTYTAGANGLLEAAATGNRVIVSKTPGIEEYISLLQGDVDTGDSGVYPVQSADPQALADQIIQAWDMPVTIQTGLVERTKEHFSLEKYAGDVQSVISKVQG